MYNSQQIEIAEGNSLSVSTEGCYMAKVSNACGTSGFSDPICIRYNLLRIEADRTEIFANQTAKLTLIGCSQFPVWKVNGIEIGGQNPINVSAGTITASCEIEPGNRYPWVSTTIISKATETVSITASQLTAYGNDLITLTGTGCSNGIIQWDINGNLDIFVNTTTVRGYGIFKARCFYTNQSTSPWVSITIGARQPETITITASTLIATASDQVVLTGTGCNANWVNWEINGQRIWASSTIVKGPGTYLGRCYYSDYHTGPWVSITIAQAPAGTLSLSADKICVSATEPLSISAVGCTNGTVHWQLPKANPNDPLITYKGTILYATGPGTYKASCLRGANSISSPLATINICAKPWNAPQFTASKSIALPDEYIELIGVCPNDAVQWGLPNPDGSYNYNQWFKTMYVKGPGTYRGRCFQGDDQSWVNIKVFPAPVNTLNIISSKTRARPEEAINFYAYGCNQGRVEWKFGTTIIDGHSLTHSGPAETMARCVGDPFTSPDWVRLIVKLNGNITPIITATKTTACPTDPVTITVSGCPAGWGHDIRWINPGQEAYYAANRSSIENNGTNYYTVFAFKGDAPMTLPGPRRFWASCRNYDWSWRTDFNDAFIDIDPAVPSTFGITANAPLEEGSTMTLAATQTFNGTPTYVWEKQVNGTWTTIAGQTARTYTVAAMTAADATTYRCTVNMGGCSKLSDPYTVAMLSCNYYIKATTATQVETYTLERQTSPANTYAPITLKLVNFAGTTPNFSGYTFTWLLNGAPVGTNSHTITINQPGTVSVSFSSTQSPNYVCDAEVDILAKPCKTPNQSISCIKPDSLVTGVYTENSMPLVVGATFIAGGDYTVTITNISGSPASGYTGTGYVALKLYGPLALNRMAVDFKDLKVDPCFAMAAGSLKSQYDPGWGGIVDVDGVVSDVGQYLLKFREKRQKIIDDFSIIDCSKRDTLYKQISDLTPLNSSLDKLSFANIEEKAILNSQHNQFQQTAFCVLNITCPLTNGRYIQNNCTLDDLSSQQNGYDQENANSVLKPNVVFDERHVLEADKIVLMHFDKDQNKKDIYLNINSDALALAKSRASDLFQNAKVIDVESFINLCEEIWIGHWAADAISDKQYNDHITEIANAGTNLDKAIAILNRGIVCKEKIEFLIFTVNEISDLIGTIAFAGRQVASNPIPKNPRAKITYQLTFNNYLQNARTIFSNSIVRRLTPGTVTGSGKVVNPTTWFNNAEKQFAEIPVSVANALRGQTFSNWNEFRKAFWKEIAKDINLSRNFNQSSVSRMKDGFAPFAKTTQQNGARKVYELHHKVEISQGGAVYSFDNLLIVTPKYHISLGRVKF